MFNFNHLYYFYIIAKLGSVTDAAKHIHTSQSSLSTQMKAFESQLGHRLFQKVGRKFELTHEGHTVFAYCQRAFEVTDEMTAHFNQMGHVKGPKISLGISDEIERRFVTNLVAQITRDWPGERKPAIRMETDRQASLVGRFAMSDFEYLLTTQPIQSAENANITEAVLPVVLVSCPDLLGSLKKSAQPAEVLRRSECDLVLPSPQLALRQQIDEYLHENRIEKNVVFESNISSAISRAVLDGLGMGFLPLPYVRKEVREKKLSIVGKKDLWDQKFIFYAKKRLADSHFSREFQRHLQIFSHHYN